MSRSVAWRRTCNDLVNWRQTEALNATMYILRETGPTGFLLQEEGEPKPFKAYLGDPHTCTCPQFKKDRDLCKHICWLLLKKFRVPQNDSITWQLGLVEREINGILHGHAAKQQRQQPQGPRWQRAQSGGNGATGGGKEALQQRPIGDDDVCPICQDELLSKHLPVTFCKFGCGNSIHIKCMKVWADHQKSSGDTVIKCPFCREDFGPLELLKQESRNAIGAPQGGRMDRHLGTDCQSCHISPIEGKCYRCRVCVNFHLCQTCFNTATHTQHPFEYRHKRNQHWKSAQRMYGAVLPQAVAQSLANREISENDYDLLMQLDNNTSTQQSDIPESVINSFPLEKVRENGALLAPGIQCRVCLRGYQVGQFVRKLPRCKHKFHRDCIDNWLLHSHSTCPVDGQSVWDPISAQMDETEQRTRAPRHPKENGQSSKNELVLEVPGVGIVRQTEESAARESALRGFGRRLPGTQPQHKPIHGSDNRNVNPLRSSFTLSGVSLGNSSEGASGGSHSDTTPAEDLPGNRLLGRAQARRSTLNKKLAIKSQRPKQKETRTVKEKKSPQFDIHSMPVVPQEQYVDDAMGPMTPTQRTIMNHLAMLNTPDEDEIMGDLNRSLPSTPQRVHSIRNCMLSSTDLRSPFVRDLPPLIESDQEHELPDYPTIGESDQETVSLNSSISLNHHRPFQRHRHQEAEAQADSGSIVMTSVRSTPDVRSVSGSQRSFINGTSSPNGESSAGGSVVSEGQPSIRSRGRQADRGQSAASGSNRSRSRDRAEPGPTDDETAILNRLQHYKDLYVGNSPDGQSPEDRSAGTRGRPPRNPRRQFGEHLALRQTKTRKKKADLRRQNNDLALEGNAFSNLTLRDLM
ncbi:uncharacterized protein LOC117344164 isoform X2 [Pecten maximus]|uniref:uncharacterized protein LOC117344164 isoform X2 n=1 Tax=Pecten maximus TaxID=6579 RepID=UPI00145885BB|nr:uncharacterized protein LOC117344164 isoform X2 [Pecten maximus]